MIKDELRKRDIKKEISDSIENGQDIVFISYVMLDDTEEYLKFALLKILEKHNKEDLFTPLYSSIKELTSNAMKANIKKVLTDEGIIDISDDMIETAQKIRTILNERALLEYGIKTKEVSLSIRIYLKVQAKKLIIQVINNLPISDKVHKRILDRIEKSSKYDNIAEFFIDHPDPAAEGMGLGLSMVVTLLNSIGINYKNFSVTTDDIEKTYTEMIIPLD